MTDVTSLSSMPTGYGHVLLLHLHTSLFPDDGDQREFDLETRVITNGNLIIPEMFHGCALNK